jgi:hypothetical protein
MCLLTDVTAAAQYVLKRDPVYDTKKGIYRIESRVGNKNWGELVKKNEMNECG